VDRATFTKRHPGVVTEIAKPMASLPKKKRVLARVWDEKKAGTPAKKLGTIMRRRRDVTPDKQQWCGERSMGQ